MYEKKDTSSPTIATKSVMMIAAIAAEERREVVTMDIGGAYLHAEMKKDVYMRLPKELSDVVVKLDDSYKKAICQLCWADRGEATEGTVWMCRERQIVV